MNKKATKTASSPSIKKSLLRVVVERSKRSVKGSQVDFQRRAEQLTTASQRVRCDPRVGGFRRRTVQ